MMGYSLMSGVLVNDIQWNGQKIISHFEILSTCPLFQGHFPGSPIFPGIGLFKVVTEIYRQAFRTETLILKEISRAKFLHPLPGATSLVCVITPDDSEHHAVSWKINHQEKEIASGVFSSATVKVK